MPAPVSTTIRWAASIQLRTREIGSEWAMTVGCDWAIRRS
jgi:hypothetical protein